MTCIVGIVDKGNVYIGGDSAGISDYNIRIRDDKKVFIKRNMIFGFTDSFRMGQILRYSFNIPHHDLSKDDYEYLCTDFIDGLISCFKNKGYATINNNEVSGGDFLLGYNGNLYQIESDFQVSIPHEAYDACGCGQFYALGAFKAIENINIGAEEKLIKALTAAEYFSSAVCSPFTLAKLEI